MRRIRLLHLNLLVYGVLAVVIALYWRELRWAAEALPLHLAGGFPAQEEQLLQREAIRLIQRRQSIPRAKELLRRSLAIDPHSSSRFHLGEALYFQGDLDAALAEYERYLEIDALDLPTYQRISAILKQQGRRAERLALLERGLARFRANVDRFRPRPDRSVAKRFNRKAERIHEKYQTAIRVLGEQLAEAAGPVQTD